MGERGVGGEGKVERVVKAYVDLERELDDLERKVGELKGALMALARKEARRAREELLKEEKERGEELLRRARKEAEEEGDAILKKAEGEVEELKARFEELKGEVVKLVAEELLGT